jgi:hypothetical protein
VNDLGAIDYLDAIFAAVRAFGAELASARAWCARARGAMSPSWRATFLSAAGAAHDRASAHLDDLGARLGALHGVRGYPPPLDRLAANVVTMTAELAVQRAALDEARLDGAPAVGVS